MEFKFKIDYLKNPIRLNAPEEIVRNIPESPGIYGIIAPDKSPYIGSSINLRARYKSYCNGAGREQRKLLKSFQRYGSIQHTWGIIELCEESNVREREKDLIILYDTIRNGLNCCLPGDDVSTRNNSELNDMGITESRHNGVNVVIRERKLNGRKSSLYLDIYYYHSGIRRRRGLNLYLTGNKKQDKETWRKAEIIAERISSSDGNFEESRLTATELIKAELTKRACDMNFGPLAYEIEKDNNSDYGTNVIINRGISELLSAMQYAESKGFTIAEMERGLLDVEGWSNEIAKGIIELVVRPIIKRLQPKEDDFEKMIRRKIESIAEKKRIESAELINIDLKL